MRGLTLLFVVGCADLQGVGEQAAAELDTVDHTCTLRTLPTACGVPPAELPCCAVQTAAGEAQMNCCPAAGVFVYRLCADGAPKCTGGGAYPDSCVGLVCPPLSWPCADTPRCCNEMGEIGPRGCAAETVPYEHSCTTIPVPGNDICVGVYDHHGRSVRVTLPDGDHAPQ